MAFRTALMMLMLLGLAPLIMLMLVRFTMLVVCVLARFPPFVMFVIPMVPIAGKPKPKPERRPRLIGTEGRNHRLNSPAHSRTSGRDTNTRRRHRRRSPRKGSPKPVPNFVSAAA
jgi:hypothetical protein